MAVKVTSGYVPAQWGWIAYMAVLATVVPFTLYFQALHYIEVLQAGVTTTLKPVVAAVAAYVLVQVSKDERARARLRAEEEEGSAVASSPQ